MRRDEARRNGTSKGQDVDDSKHIERHRRNESRHYLKIPLAEVGPLAELPRFALLMGAHEDLAERSLFDSGNFLVTLVAEFISRPSALQTEDVFAGNLNRNIARLASKLIFTQINK